MIRTAVLVAPVILAGWAASAAAQTAGSVAAPGISERSIVDIVHRTNIAEAQSAQLAAQRAVNEQVRSYARRMIADHTRADQQLLKAQGNSERWGLSNTAAMDANPADHGTGSMGATGAIGTTGSSGYAAAGTAGSTGSAAGSGGSVAPGSRTTAAPTTAATTAPATAPAGSSSTGTGSMAATGSIGTTGSAGYARAGETPRDTISSGDENVQMMTALSSYTGAAFDRAYIDNQVSVHEQMLQHLDKNLIPSARDAQLRSTLEQIRASVAEHLRMAQDIQKNWRS